VAYLLSKFKHMFLYLWDMLTSKLYINKLHPLAELKENTQDDISLSQKH
jgi:hypothetical protein